MHERFVLRMAVVLVMGLLALTTACPQDIPGALEQLQSDDAQQRIKALEQLAGSTDPAIFDPVCRLLQDANPMVRMRAVAVLGKFGGMPAVAKITPLLQDDFLLVRGQAVTSLGDTRTVRAAELVAPLARDAKSELRMQAVTAVGMLLRDLQGDAQVVKLLFPLLLDLHKDPEQRIVRQAQQAMEVVLQKRPAGLPLVEMLVARLNDPDPVMRQRVLDLLPRCASPAALPALIPMLKTPNPPFQVENAILDIMRSRVTPKDRAQLVSLRQMLADPEARYRGKAASLLGRLRDIDSVEPLIKLLNDPAVCGIAAEALLTIHDRRALPALCALVTSPNGRVRCQAVTALSWAGDAASLDKLPALCRDADMSVRLAALRALKGSHDPRLTATLLPLVNDADQAIRQEALQSLAGSHEQAVLTAALDHASDARTSVRTAACAVLAESGDAKMLPFLRVLAADNQPQVRQAAAVGMVRLGDAGGIDILLTMRKEKQIYDEQLGKLLQQTRSPLVVEPLMKYLYENGVANVEGYHSVYYALQALQGLGAPAVERIIALLEDKRPEIRLGAIYACCQLPDARMTPALLPRLQEEDERGRILAVDALCRIGDARGTVALVEAMAGATPRVRKAITRGFYDIRSPEATAALAGLLSDPDEETRRMAIWSLWYANDPASIDVLLPMLKDEKWLVRFAAAEVLGKLKPEKAVDALAACLTDTQAEVRRSAAQSLAAIGTARSLGAMFDGLQGVTGWYYLQMLKDVADPQLLPVLLAAAVHKEPLARALAVGALGNYTDARAVDAAEAALTDPDERVRQSAAFALGNAKLPRTVTALCATAGKDSSAKVRAAAVAALGKIGDRTAFPSLLPLLASPDTEVRMNAANALGDLGDPRAIEPLLNALEPQDYGLSGAIVRALGKFGDPRILPMLLAYARDGFGGLADAALTALAGMKIPQAEDAMQDLLTSNSLPPHLRRKLPTVLAACGSESAIRALLELVASDDTDIRGAAAEALGRAKAKSAVQPLCALLADPSYAATGAVGYPGLYTHANITDTTRMKAAWALGEIGDPAAVEPLIAALGWGATRDRAAVAEALGKLGDRRAVAPLTTILPQLTGDARQAALTALDILAKK